MADSQDLIAVIGMALREVARDQDTPDAAESLEATESFDAAFFGLTSAQAAQLEPGERRLLEVTWHALEDGGVRPSRLAPGRCAVFVAAETEEPEVLARLGPALDVRPTGLCSRRAVVRGRRALLSGSCDVAVCGGLDRRCGLVVLRRLRDASRDGDRVCSILDVGAVQAAARAGRIDHAPAAGVTALIGALPQLHVGSHPELLGPTERAGAAHADEGIAPIVTVSARSATSLATVRDATAALIGPFEAAAVAQSSNLDREHFERRVAEVICRRRGWSPVRDPGVAPLGRIAFMFPGHGAQYPLMGLGLYRREPVFREAVMRCAGVARGQLDVSLDAALFDPDVSPRVIDETQYAQAAMFTISYALSCLWQSWGVVPDAVVGHSVGEFAAACISGALSLDEALTLVIERGRRTQQLRTPGAMRAILASETEVRRAIAELGGVLDVAAVNTPTQTVVAGPPEAVEALAGALATAGIGSKRIRVPQAFHSALVEPMLEPFARAAQHVSPKPARCTFFSTVTAQPQPGAQLDAAYWCRNSRVPVLFCETVQAMSAAGYRAFVEVGPRSTLTAFTKEALLHAPPALVVASSGRPPRAGTQGAGTPGGRETVDLAKAVATLYVHGAEIDWDAVHRGRRHPRVDLPAYPFDGQPLPRDTWDAPARTVSESFAHGGS